MERHYLSHEMRNSSPARALCGLQFHPDDLDYSKWFSPGSCFPSRVNCRDCLEILDQTVPAHHWEQWVEIHRAAEGAARRYTAYYPDCRIVSIGRETEAILPVRGPARPTRIWSNPGYDPEIPYLEFQNLSELQTLLTGATGGSHPQAATRILRKEAPRTLEQTAARLERTIRKEPDQEILSHLERALAALIELQASLPRQGNEDFSLNPEQAGNFRDARQELDAARREKIRHLPPELKDLPARTPQST